MNGAKWDSSLNLEENVKNSLDLLTIFNRRVDADINLDGFLVEIDDEKYGDTRKPRTCSSSCSSFATDTQLPPSLLPQSSI